MNHTEGAIHRSGEQWTPSRTSTLTISVIDKPQKAPPPGARKVPFGFGVRDEPVAEEGSQALVFDGWQGNPS